MTTSESGSRIAILAPMRSELRPLVRFVLANPKRVPELARLGRGLKLATNTAASAAVRAIGKMNAI